MLESLGRGPDVARIRLVQLVIGLLQIAEQPPERFDGVPTVWRHLLARRNRATVAGIILGLKESVIDAAGVMMAAAAAAAATGAAGLLACFENVQDPANAATALVTAKEPRRVCPARLCVAQHQRSESVRLEAGPSPLPSLSQFCNLR